MPEAASLEWRSAALPVELLLELQQGAGFSAIEAAVNPFANLPGVVGGALLLAVPLMKGAGWRARTLTAVALIISMPLGMKLSHVFDDDVHAWVLDLEVGQAVVLRLPGPEWVLDDGGGIPGSTFDVGARAVAPALRSLGFERVGLAISSHPHADHLAGLASLLRLGMIERLWLPKIFIEDGR